MRECERCPPGIIVILRAIRIACGTFCALVKRRFPVSRPIRVNLIPRTFTYTTLFMNADRRSEIVSHRLRGTLFTNLSLVLLFYFKCVIRASRTYLQSIISSSIPSLPLSRHSSHLELWRQQREINFFLIAICVEVDKFFTWILRENRLICCMILMIFCTEIDKFLY